MWHNGDVTGRTHDLAAFTALSWALVAYMPNEVTLGTVVVAVGANFIGGLYPDLDNASADIWKKIPGGSLIGKIIAPFMGGHRLISHSALGMVVTGGLLWLLLGFSSSFLLVDMNLVWWAFMIGYGSHLLADMLTREGLPLFLPLPWKLGLPPIKRLRLETGGVVEKGLVYPGLLVSIMYIYYQNYQAVIDLLRYHLN